jgi:hypothetical protein
MLIKIQLGFILFFLIVSCRETIQKGKKFEQLQKNKLSEKEIQKRREELIKNLNPLLKELKNFSSKL